MASFTDPRTKANPEPKRTRVDTQDTSDDSTRTRPEPKPVPVLKPIFTDWAAF